jgi:hypothetical protein
LKSIRIPNPNPNSNPRPQIGSDPSRKGEIQKGKRGRGKPRGSTSPLCRTARGEKRAGPGALLVGLRPKGCHGQATRRRHAHPLGSTHTGEGVDDGVVAPLLRLLLTRWLAPTALRRESGVRRRERERTKENEVRVSSRARGVGVLSDRKWCSIVGFRLTARVAPGRIEPRWARGILAQAQVAA